MKELRISGTIVPSDAVAITLLRSIPLSERFNVYKEMEGTIVSKKALKEIKCLLRGK